MSEDANFTVDLPVFSGPFQMLADLILEQKIDVCDVAIASVTDRFIAHAKAAETWPLEDATWFLAVCALLLELKVRRLMPKYVGELDDDDVSSSPDLAYARSIELAAFRQAVVDLAGRMQDEESYHPRLAGPADEFAELYPDVMASVTAEKLAKMAASILAPPPLMDLSHVTPITLSVGDEIGNVAAHMEREGRASFRALVADCPDRIYVVVRFLALLELYRDGRIELAQAATFGEIEIEWLTVA